MEEKLLLSWEESGKRDRNPAAAMSWAMGQEMVFTYVLYLALS